MLKCQEQEDEIFQRARLVNCGYFIRIILGGRCMPSWRKAIIDHHTLRLCWCHLGFGTWWKRLEAGSLNGEPLSCHLIFWLLTPAHFRLCAIQTIHSCLSVKETSFPLSLTFCIAGMPLYLLKIRRGRRKWSKDFWWTRILRRWKKKKKFLLVARTHKVGQITVKQFKTLARSRPISSQNVTDWTFNGCISFFTQSQ